MELARHAKDELPGHRRVRLDANGARLSRVFDGLGEFSREGLDSRSVGERKGNEKRVLWWSEVEKVLRFEEGRKSGN